VLPSLPISGSAPASSSNTTSRSSEPPWKLLSPAVS
jgi:hypothetical protein